ncbi:MAG TPA: CheR family methyltransferase [Acidobacteriota bacterium]|nr:CheR family methyltransferase [Acidobacteriota bacterium]
MTNQTAITFSAGYQAICGILLREFGVDPSEANALIFQYKVEKYMEKHRLSSAEECVGYILEDKSRLLDLSDHIYSQSTHFNRHPEHFRFMVETSLREGRREKASPENPLRVWSLACSSGQEAYTIAFNLMEHLFPEPESWSSLKVEGADCSRLSLETARKAVYSREDVERLSPLPYHKYFEEAGPDHLAVLPQVREKVDFDFFNLVEPIYPYLAQMDYVFLRNALDFHTSHSRTAVLSKVRMTLKRGGYLILGDCPDALAYGYEEAAPGCLRAI